MVAGVVGSVDDDEVVGQCLDAAFGGFGRLDGIVNNVGINAFHGPLAKIPRSRWDRTMALNLTAPLIIVQQAVQRGFGKERPGVVVNMSTVGAQQPQQGIGAYCTSKAALEMLTKVLALELGAQGIRVRSEEHTSELQSLMRISYAVFCLKKKKRTTYSIVNYH